MTSEKLKPVIGAGFGVVFVLANTGSVPTGVAALLRVLAVVAFVAVAVIALRSPRSSGSAIERPASGGFSRGYWLVVLAEVAALGGGLVVLNGPLHLPHAAVAWISTVVGVHFIALAVVWRQSFIHWLGAALILCGATGLVLTATGSAVWGIDLVAGVARRGPSRILSLGQCEPPVAAVPPVSLSFRSVDGVSAGRGLSDADAHSRASRRVRRCCYHTRAGAGTRFPARSEPPVRRCRAAGSAGVGRSPG